MHGVGSVACQHPGLPGAGGARHQSAPALSACQLQRPGTALALHLEGAQGAAAGLCEFAGKDLIAVRKQFAGTLGRDGPDHRDFLAVRAAERQKSQNALG